MNINTLADLKRALQPGVTVTLTGSTIDSISQKYAGKPRKVGKVQTNAITLEMDGAKPSWLYFDSAKHFIFRGDNSFQMLMDPENSTAANRYEIAE